MKYYRKTAHSKYDLKVHVVFITKYRKRILTGEIKHLIRDLIRQVCTEIEVEIIEGKVARDHVHLFVSYPPGLSVSSMMQKIKGKSSYKIFQLSKDVRGRYWGRSFWARGYLAVSTGNITDEVIQKYIEQQEGEPVHNLK